MPQHDHVLQGTNTNANNPIPNGNILAAFNNAYRDLTGLTSPASGTVANVGGGQAHNNMQPTIAVNFCIALQGLFPSRN